MSISGATMAIARAQLADRIDLLAREVSHLSIGRVAYAVDDLRREARACRFDALAALASNLERDLATSGGTAVVMPYLAAMSDALDASPARAGTESSLLASVGLRLHG